MTFVIVEMSAASVSLRISVLALQWGKTLLTEHIHLARILKIVVMPLVGQIVPYGIFFLVLTAVTLDALNDLLSDEPLGLRAMIVRTVVAICGAVLAR